MTPKTMIHIFLKKMKRENMKTGSMIRNAMKTERTVPGMKKPMKTKNMILRKTTQKRRKVLRRPQEAEINLPVPAR